MNIRQLISRAIFIACVLTMGSYAIRSAAAQGEWPVFRGNMARTGVRTLVPGPGAPVELGWAVTDPEADLGDASPSPAVASGKVFTAASFTSVFFRGGHVYALDADSGDILWRFKTQQQAFSSPAVAGGRVYFGEGLHTDANSQMYCVNADDGNLVWAFPSKSHVESSPAVVDGRVYFGAGDDGVYCVTADKGEQVWHYEGVHVDVGPAVDDKHVYFGTGYGTKGMYCIDRNTGKKVWSVDTPYGAWGTPSVVGGDLFYAIGNGNFYESAPAGQRSGRVICAEAATGNERWHFDAGDGVLSAIAVWNDRVYFGSRDGNVYCLDRASGDEVWRFETDGPVVSSPAVDGETVYIGSDDGNMYALDAAQGEVKWIYDIAPKAGAGVKIWSSPALGGGKVYFGSTQKYIFCLDSAGSADLGM